MAVNDDIVHFCLFALLISNDLPARSAFQNFNGSTGYNACPTCLHPGIPVPKLKGGTFVRYIKQSEPSELRNHG